MKKYCKALVFLLSAFFLHTICQDTDQPPTKKQKTGYFSSHSQQATKNILPYTGLLSELQLIILSYLKLGLNQVKTVQVDDIVQDLYHTDKGYLVAAVEHDFTNVIKPIFFEYYPADLSKKLEEELNSEEDMLNPQETTFIKNRKAGTFDYMSFYKNNYCVKYYSVSSTIKITKKNSVSTAIKAGFIPTNLIGHGVIEICPQEKYLIASFGIRNSIRVWELKTQKLIKEFNPKGAEKSATGIVSSIAMSPNHRYVAVGYYGGQAGIHNMSTDEFIAHEFDTRDAVYIVFTTEHIILACGKKIIMYEIQEDINLLSH